MTDSSRAFGAIYTFAGIAEVPALALGGVLLQLILVWIIYAMAAILMFAAMLVAWIVVSGALAKSVEETQGR